MSNDIPDVSQRISARALEGQDVPNLRQSLEEGFRDTGIFPCEALNHDA